MKFLWPQALWLLLAVPALVGGYVYLLRRRKKYAVRYASLGLIKAAVGPGQRFRRHFPPFLFLVALIASILAIARPSAVITLPSEQRTIILAIDVSLSMRAADIEPSRLAAAQEAAKGFVQEQPADVRIGVVSFAGTASVVQAPTRNRDDVVAAIDRLQLQRHTAIGSGIIVSLAALFPDAGIDLESLLFGGRPARDGGRPARDGDRPIAGADKANKLGPEPFTPVPAGSHPSAAIILLTDGRRTMGPDPADAARMAAERGVRVYTVGFGTAAGGMADVGGWSIYMRFDEETLKTVADITKAEYFYAGSAADLKKVYQQLNTQFVLERKETEVSALAIAAAAMLALAAAVLSVLWFNRSV
jgi:Ca-activated chloride channel family protein